MSAFPTNPRFESVNLRAVTQTLVSRSQSGKTFVREIPGHQWAFSATYSSLTRDQFADIFAFAMAQKGVYGTFIVAPPDMAEPRGTAQGTVTVLGGGQAGTSLSVSGADPNQPEFLKAMDIFTIAGDNKVYMVTETVSSDVGGLASIQFQPSLEKSPVDGASIKLRNVAFTMSFANPVQEYTVKSPVIYDYKVDLIEAV